MSEPSIARLRGLGSRGRGAARCALFDGARIASARSLRIIRFRGALLFATIALTGAVASGTDVDTRAASDAFAHLRKAKLEYHGPSEDFANLTELRIGWFGPTDLNDPLTGDLWWAANQAVREANANSAPPVRDCEAACPALTPPSSLAPSLPHPSSILPFRLVPRWSVDVWGTGVSQLTRMVFDEQPLALIGSIDSASTHLAEQVVAKANLPLVSPIATDKTVTLAGVSWMFSCAPSDTAIARALVDEILSTSPTAGARIALLASTDHEPRMTSREIMRELSSRDRLPDARFDLPPGLAISEPVLSTLHGTPPDIIVLIAGVEDSARWVRAIRDRAGRPPLIFGSPAMARTRFLALADDAAEGVRFPLLWMPDAPGATGSDFVARFLAERGHDPDYTAVLTYDSTRLLLTAIRHAGPNRARIREALIALSPWPGFAGPIQFDGTGQNTQTAVPLGTIRGGIVVPCEAFGGCERERVAESSTRSRSQPHSSPVGITTALSP